MALESSYTVMI